MDQWITFKNSIADLTKSNYTSSEVKKKWRIIIRDFKEFRPNHLTGLLSLLNQKSSKYESKILDHGCGSGITLFFLASQGYSNIWGVDINNTKSFEESKNNCNKVFKIIFNNNIDRIQRYNGKKINFDDDTFDYVYSQQVIEHVESDLLDNFILEESRILKRNGLALHQIPHRLSPFEGHTKKWFIHWFPKRLYFYFLRHHNQSLWLVKNALFLRWPWEIKSIFKKYFQEVDNIVSLRLKKDIVSEEYSRKEKIIR